MKKLVVIFFALILSTGFLYAESDSDLWRELVDKATQLYRQGETAKDKGDLLEAYFLLSQASFMFPKDKALQMKIQNLKMKIEESLSGEDCDQSFLFDKLQATEQELVDLKKKLVEEKEEWQAYYDQKLEQMRKSYEDKIEVLDEKYKFELRRQKSEYEDLLAQKQEEYREKLSEYKDKIKSALSALEHGLKQKDEVIAKKDQKIKELLKSYSALESVIEQKYKNQLLALTDKVQMYEKKIDSMENRIRGQKHYISSLEKDLADKKAKISKLSLDLKDAKDQIDMLKQETKQSSIDSEKRYQDCLARLADAKGQVKTLRQEVEKLKLDKENVLAKFDVGNKKILEQQQMLDDLEKRLKERDIVIRNLKDKINGLKRKLFVLEHQQKASVPSKSSKKSFHPALYSSGEDKSKGIKEKKVSSTKDLPADELFDKAMELIDEQEYELARDLLKQVLEKEPDNTVARYMLDSVNLLLED